MSKAKNSDVRPTYTGYIATSKDALIIFQAVLSGVLTPVHRRPSESERSELVKSGNVFVFIEETSRIKRWTDGISWSPSRILGRFLIYRELSKNSGTKSDDHNSKNRRSSSVSDKLLKPDTRRLRGNSDSDLSNLKSSACPITAYAMAGGKDIISGINKKKRPRTDSVYRNDENIVINNDKGTTNNVTINNGNSNCASDDITNGNNNVSKSRSSYDLQAESLDDTIYKTDGLIKKSNSLTLYTNTSYKKTIHLVSYYRSGDVLENRLEKPSEDAKLKDIEISFDLLEALKNTSLGHAIPNKKNGEFTIESHGFMDTDGFDNETILKFAKEYYTKYNMMSKRRQINPVMQNYDPYGINHPTGYYVSQSAHDPYQSPQPMEHPQSQINQYRRISYLPPQQQQQAQQQQQPHIQGPLSNYSYKFDYASQPVQYQQISPDSAGSIYGQINRPSATQVPISASLSTRPPTYLANSQKPIGEALMASHSSRIESPSSNSYEYSGSGSLVPPLPIKSQRSSSDDQYVSKKLPQLHRPLIPLPNYDVYPYGVNRSYLINSQHQQQQQILHSPHLPPRHPHPPPPPLLQTPIQDQSQIHTRTHSPNEGPDQVSTQSHSPYSYRGSQFSYHTPLSTGLLTFSQLPGVMKSPPNQYFFPSSARQNVEPQQSSNITRCTNTPTSSYASSVRLSGPTSSIGTFNSATTVSRADTPNKVVTHYATNPADFTIS